MDPGLYPNCKVFGAEPADADDAFRSKRDGTLRKHESTCKTVADGLRTTLGPNTFPIVRDLVVAPYDDVDRKCVDAAAAVARCRTATLGTDDVLVLLCAMGASVG